MKSNWDELMTRQLFVEDQRRRAIVRNLGEEILAESDSSAGTRVTVRFPRPLLLGEKPHEQQGIV